MQMRLKITINNKVHITIVQLKYHFLIQEIYILLANVLGMFMIKLVEKSDQHGGMQIAGQLQLKQQDSL
ncbi:Uncharacterised protein [Mycobacteroides abscessus subsp. massiliense]|nr:Uncharacterised protein [Mycobacteroides abscessus subsp. massiliense]